MEKFFKKLITLAVFSVLGYAGYKIYKIIKATIDLDKVLPQYLENVFGEKPTISIQLTFNKITLTAGFSESLFKKKEELEKSILEYITDFYPAICPKYLEIEVIEKTTETEETTEDKEEKKVDKKKDKKLSEKDKDDSWSI